MFEAISRVFNWKQHPSGVFFLAIPLALTGFGSLGLLAWLQWTQRGDAVYALMLAIGLVVLGVALLPAWRMHKLSKRFEQTGR